MYERAQSRSPLCHPMDCSLPGSSVPGISQARTLEWVAISFSRGSAQPRDQTCVSGTGRQVLTAEPLGSPLKIVSYFNFPLHFSDCVSLHLNHLLHVYYSLIFPFLISFVYPLSIFGLHLFLLLRFRRILNFAC